MSITYRNLTLPATALSYASSILVTGMTSTCGYRLFATE
jgi:hypothetical protein